MRLERIMVQRAQTILYYITSNSIHGLTIESKAIIIATGNLQTLGIPTVHGRF